MGDAVDFGDIHNNIRSGCGFASRTRAIQYGGYRTPQGDNSQQIDYVDIATKGNAMDFGDLSEKTDRLGATSVCHGGLGGY